MKNVILMLVLNISVLFSQNIIDPPKIFRKDTLSILDNRPSPFLLGWNWPASGRLLDQALSIQTYHGLQTIGYIYQDTIFKSDTIFYISAKFRPNGYSNVTADSIKSMPVLFDLNTTRGLLTRVDNDFFNGMSIYLEPTLSVNSGYDFKPRWNDVNGGVYGFRFLQQRES